MAEAFVCTSCGGKLEYQPGQKSLICPYCGAENELPEREIPQEHNELDFEKAIHDFELAAVTMDVHNVVCPGCQAEFSVESNQTTATCDFCGTQVVIEGTAQKAMEPQYMLPFDVDKDSSKHLYQKWLKSRWFAPSSLKKRARMAEPLKGIYLPYYTFDSNTSTDYEGERGTDHTRTDSKGNRSTYTTWRRVKGRVSVPFDDVLTPAGNSLPRKVLLKLESWELGKLIDYTKGYLAGFTAESYTWGIKQGFEDAKEMMKETIETTIRRDIGGDHQRIHNTWTSYFNTTFKYILLPVWAIKYKFKKKYYTVVVNGQTGEVQGERPVSWFKIVGLVLFIAAVGLGVYFGIRYFQTTR